MNKLFMTFILILTEILSLYFVPIELGKLTYSWGVGDGFIEGLTSNLHFWWIGIASTVILIIVIFSCIWIISGICSVIGWNYLLSEKICKK